MPGDGDIAVIGVGCRFPDAWDPDQFWRNLDAGLVSMRELPPEKLARAGHSEEAMRAADFVRVATTLPGVEEFAGEFFGYPPREAETMDPQQRIFLEVCWEALEAAGHPPRRVGPVTGVFAGAAAGTYSAALFAMRARESGLAAAIDDLDLTVGGQPDFLTSRVAYKLGLRGPAVSVQTACSSSLYAVHYATLSLLAGECDIALAGGATVLEPHGGYRRQSGGIRSDDGYCRPFDARSSGTAYSSGIGVVALRPLADALADGDPILAVLRGSAVGNDGEQRLGFTAPSPDGVATVVSQALGVAGVEASQVRYVEAHGAGTAVGDHIELLGLTEALRCGAGSRSCALGSVKGNIGHTGPTAGVAGLIKAVHVARTGSLPPHPMFERPRDPGVMADSPFHVPTERQDCAEADRHVLVNSMGVGGTNVAVVLAAPPAPARPPAPPRDVVTLVVSARTRLELDRLSRLLADVLDGGRVPVADAAHTLRVGRHSFEERRVVRAPAGRLAGALRLPRPPLARTVRATERRALLVVAPGTEVPAGLLDLLRSTLPATTEVVNGPQAGGFAILVGGGEPGPDRHVLDTGGPAGDFAGRVEEALAAAWLHGVEVDWEPLAAGTGRRVALPAYPFTRRRYWALDPSVLAPGGPVPATGSAPPPVDSLEEDVLAVWRDMFGIDTVSMDDEFGALGGTSLLSVRMVLELQQRHGVLVNVHRAGGSRATVRRVAEIIRARRSGAARGSRDVDPVADGDGDLVDADLQMPLGPPGATDRGGDGVLLSGATGYLGAFLLHELLRATDRPVYCLTRAATADEAARRLRGAAAAYGLPAPDPRRVHPVPGDLRDVAGACDRYRDGELAARVGHVLHCAARVVFTEPYRALREDNVVPVAALVRWMRGHGLGDLTFVSSVAATGPALGAGGRHLETRDQPLDPQQGGYGVSKWVGERLLERAGQDGMRVRVFRPGFILASGESGACNAKDLIWHILASGLAVGAHPRDERGMPVAPVDVVAAGIVELGLSAGSAGRAYHVVDAAAPSLARLFGLLADAGLPTAPMDTAEWQNLVAARALATGNPVLSSVALYDVEGHQLAEDGMQADGWRPWLAARGRSAAPTGDLLRRGLAFLAGCDTGIADLLPHLAGTRGGTVAVR